MKELIKEGGGGGNFRRKALELGGEREGKDHAIKKVSAENADSCPWTGLRKNHVSLYIAEGKSRGKFVWGGVSVEGVFMFM